MSRFRNIETEDLDRVALHLRGELVCPSRRSSAREQVQRRYTEVRAELDRRHLTRRGETAARLAQLEVRS